MTKDECYYLGYLSKTQGFKGGLLAFLDVDNTGDYINLESILVDLNGVLTPFFVEYLQLKDKNFVYLKLEDVDDRDSAIILSNKDLYLPLTDLPDLGDDHYYLHELNGMKVVDKQAGELGNVDTVLDYSTNPLIQVIKGSREILIPLNDDFVLKVDKALKTIEVDLPEGLIEVNQE
jgi:16S rRNA processing protein RimM